LIGLIVDTQGMPQNLRVVRPLAYGLTEKAIEAVSKYRFKPAMRGGQPVPVYVTIEVNFHLY
jgi:TonB family protein